MCKLYGESMAEVFAKVSFSCLFVSTTTQYFVDSTFSSITYLFSVVTTPLISLHVALLILICNSANTEFRKQHPHSLPDILQDPFLA